MTNEPKWQLGQQAVIDRRLVVTIDRVTPTGRVTAGGRAFDADGYERSGSRYNRSRLEPITNEIQAQIALAARGSMAAINAISAVDGAEKWLRHSFGLFAPKIRDVADIERAEKIAAVLNEIMGGKEDV